MKMILLAINLCFCTDCFKWAVISALFPVATNSDRLLSYSHHENAIDCLRLQFPVEPNQIPVFEEDKQTIAIHCLAYCDGRRGRAPLRPR